MAQVASSWGTMVTPGPAEAPTAASLLWDFPTRRDASEHPWQQSTRSWAPQAGALGISVVLEVAVEISASVLVFAAFAGCGMIIPLCQPQNFHLRGKAWMGLTIYTNGLVSLASVLTLVDIVLWSYDQGLTAVLILPTMFLFHVILVTSLDVAIVLFRLKVLHWVTDKTAQRLLYFTMHGGLVLDVVINGLLIRYICLMQEKGCVEPEALTWVLITAAGICFLPLICIVGIRHQQNKAPAPLKIPSAAGSILVFRRFLFRCPALTIHGRNKTFCAPPCINAS